MTTVLRAVWRKVSAPAGRAWLYGIALAALPLLVLDGYVGREAAPLWIALLGSVLVPGAALANVGERGVRRPSRRSRP